MWRHLVSAAMVLVLSGNWAHGDGATKKTVQDLRAAVKQLRASKKPT
jgi:hypothetical protein